MTFITVISIYETCVNQLRKDFFKLSFIRNLGTSAHVIAASVEGFAKEDILVQKKYILGLLQVQ